MTPKTLYELRADIVKLQNKMQREMFSVAYAPDPKTRIELFYQGVLPTYIEISQKMQEVGEMIRLESIELTKLETNIETLVEAEDNSNEQGR